MARVDRVEALPAAGIRDRYDGTLRQQFGADTELIDEICAEGERFSKQLK